MYYLGIFVELAMLKTMNYMGHLEENQCSFAIRQESEYNMQQNYFLNGLN